MSTPKLTQSRACRGPARDIHIAMLQCKDMNERLYSYAITSAAVAAHHVVQHAPSYQTSNNVRVLLQASCLLSMRRGHIS